MAEEFVEIEWQGGGARIEYVWVGTGERAIVFLHEGLGSRAMWRDFPQQLCDAAGMRGLVYSRPGFGKSAPRRALDARFLHEQAYDVLPAFLKAIGLGGEPPWLFGHSDGGSIALLHAARFPEADAGIVVVAPHLFVEDVTVRGIREARALYDTRDWKARLARYHDDADAVFRGWSDLWLAQGFRSWNIERDIEGIRCPVLAMQGASDEYGTMEQVRGIARRVPHASVLELPGGHAPHREHPEALIAAAVGFIGSR